MIHSNAGRIDRTGQRICGDELGEAWTAGSAIVDAVWKRIDIEKRLNRHWCLLTHEVVGNISDGSCDRLSEPKPLIRDKEEGVGLAGPNSRNDDRTAQCSAEIVLPERGYSLSVVIVEPIIGIEEIIAQIIEDASVEDWLCPNGSKAKTGLLEIGRIPRNRLNPGL